MCFCKGRNLDGNLAGRVSITELLQVETVALSAAAVRSVRAAWHMFLPWAWRWWLLGRGCWHHRPRLDVQAVRADARGCESDQQRVVPRKCRNKRKLPTTKRRVIRSLIGIFNAPRPVPERPRLVLKRVILSA